MGLIRKRRLTHWSWLVLIGTSVMPASAVSTEDLLRLLEQRRCTQCKLQDADLVRADLRDARLRDAQLQGANLSGARLEGADLRGANLSHTSLVGANLRGSDLRGAQLDGTDLRQADLTGAQLDANGLNRSHWQQAKGIDPGLHSYVDLHNAGVSAAQDGRQPQAEQFFGEAIRKQPESGISWVARGIMRVEQGKTELAAQDFNQAASLYQQAGDDEKVKQLQDLARTISAPEKGANGGNGMGSQLLKGALSTFQALAPLAIKAFSGI